MKISRILLILVAAGGLALSGLRLREARTLRQQNEVLRQTAAEAQRLCDANVRLAGLTLDKEELNRLRTERSELMKLRSEVGKLRRSARVTILELQTEIQSTWARAEAEQKKGDLIQARYDARVLAQRTRSSLQGLWSLAHEAARVSAGQLPDSFERIESIAAAQPEKHVLRRWVPVTLNSTNSWEIPSQSFEFLRQSRPLTIRDKSALFLRERAPRPVPDGGWFRAYVFADGRVEEAFSSEGNFEEWERQQASGKPGSAVLRKD